MALSLPILETLIQNQEDAIRRHTFHSYIIVIIGIAIILFTNFFLKIDGSESVKSLLNIGGGLISTLSAYPINQIITRKEKSNTYKMFKQNMQNMNVEESKKFEEMIWDSIKKI